MLSSIKQVKVGRGIPMLCIRSFVHYINIYSRIVIQLNMYVKIITSSGFKSTILTDFVQGQLRVSFRFGRCLKFPGSKLIYRKLSSPPQALRLRARLDTKWNKKKIGAEFMTSVSYRPEVIREFKFDFRYQYRYRCFHFRSHFATGNFKALSYHDR